MTKQQRQGDVLVTRAAELPAGAKQTKTLTVAYGEATGHHHTLTAGEVYLFGDQQWVVVPEGGAELRHQEHGALVLDPGVYQVDLQVEVDPFTGLDRRVMD